MKLNKRNIVLGVITYIIAIAIISSTIGREIIRGRTPSLFSFSVIHLSGYLFFIVMPVEALFPYYLSLGRSPLVLFSLALATAIFAQLIDYGIGYSISRKVIHSYIGEKRYDKYKKLIDKYGNWTIFIFNLLPLSSPILFLLAGMLRYRLISAILYSAAGLAIKYLVIISFWVI